MKNLSFYASVIVVSVLSPSSLLGQGDDCSRCDIVISNPSAEVQYDYSCVHNKSRKNVEFDYWWGDSDPVSVELKPNGVWIMHWDHQQKETKEAPNLWVRWVPNKNNRTKTEKTTLPSQPTPDISTCNYTKVFSFSYDNNKLFLQ